MGHTYKYVAHRPFEGAIKTVTVKRTKQGDYYLCVSVVQEQPDIHPRVGKSTGMDFGLKTFLTLDDGIRIESPLWFKQALKDIRRVHRNLSRKEAGSRNRERARVALARVYEQVSTRRTDWFFKLADSLTKEYAVICIEDLNIDGMKRLWGRKVSDLAFSEFVDILHWVALKNNAEVIEVDRWYPSSKTCNVCGYVHTELALSDREWDCPSCGAHLDRDVNAAINIHAAGMGVKIA